MKLWALIVKKGSVKSILIYKRTDSSKLNTLPNQRDFVVVLQIKIFSSFLYMYSCVLTVFKLLKPGLPLNWLQSLGPLVNGLQCIRPTKYFGKKKMRECCNDLLSFLKFISCSSWYWFTKICIQCYAKYLYYTIVNTKY